MNIARNMEVIFVAALAFAGVTGMATASRPPVEQAPAHAAAAESNVQVVTVSAKRLTAAEKAAAQ